MLPRGMYLLAPPKQATANYTITIQYIYRTLWNFTLELLTKNFLEVAGGVI